MNRLDSIREVLDIRFADLQQEIDSLKEENYRLHNGFQGACYACEPVGELNQKLVERGHALYRALAYFTDSFSSFMDEDGFSQEKKAVEDWKELFDNNIPEQNYED
jgi:FtsZ-binding cell division protein ZapB